MGSGSGAVELSPGENPINGQKKRKGLTGTPKGKDGGKPEGKNKAGSKTRNLGRPKGEATGKKNRKRRSGRVERYS